MRGLLFLLALLIILPARAQEKAPLIKPVAKISLPIPEPSGISLNGKGTGFYVVSDNGILFEIDSMGNILQRSETTGMDYEAVFADTLSVYVVDESLRRVKIHSRDSLVMTSEISIPYSGARNQGWESLAYVPELYKFVLFTEKNPVIVFELDSNLQLQRQQELDHLPEISDCVYYEDHIYALSDEGHEILKLNPESFAIIQRWRIGILNPEGICFDERGKLYILSDARETLYQFEALD